MKDTLSFLSTAPGIGGRLKDSPEDFVVEEIGLDGTVFGLGSRVSRPDEPGRFVHFVLEKRNWTTMFAVKELAKKLRAGPKRFGFAGSKDRCAVTTQLMSVEGVDKAAVASLAIKDMRINGAWKAKERVTLGALSGNRFAVKVRGAADGADAVVEKINSELGGKFPNYFGEQRFGTNSRNTHVVGEMLVRGRAGDAAMEFLCGGAGGRGGGAMETNKEAKAARDELRGSGDFAAALKNYPKHLKLERTMLAHLAGKPDDFAGAFRALPRQTLLLFVHAFQSHIFNALLSERVREGVEMEEGEFLCAENALGFPDIARMDVDGWLCMKIIGHDSNPNRRERAMLDSLGVKKEDFRMKGLPEVAPKGTFRTAFAPLRDFNFADDTFRFSLQPGAYATSALREFIEVDKS